ncbi:MAG: phage virion morphogenesis protein [Prevotellaceae bacterium]|jgi:phage gpG-like protein|nr:phage virion morphogenesis protein [Prevotellaceae bacterium]
MAKIDQLMTKLLTDVKVELADEFDRNFQRKAFFATPWKQRRNTDAKGSLLMIGGHLRRSLRATVRGHNIVFSSSLPYAAIHNEGGTLTVTAKMKKFFWYKYSQAAGSVKTLKSGKRSTSQRNRRLGREAEMWKAMALMKVGSKINIPERRFIGNAPEVKQAVTRVTDKWVKEDLNNSIRKQFNK